MYNVINYSREQAQKRGEDIKPSVKKNKNIDVIKNGKVVASIGDKRYMKTAKATAKATADLHQVTWD